MKIALAEKVRAMRIQKQNAPLKELLIDVLERERKMWLSISLYKAITVVVSGDCLVFLYPARERNGYSRSFTDQSAQRAVLELCRQINSCRSVRQIEVLHR